MSYKPLPKPASARALQKKYAELVEITHGRFNIATDFGKSLSSLLHRYFMAFSNLYGLIPLRTAWELLGEIEPELIKQKKLLKKDFFAFSDILRKEDLLYYILDEDEIWPDAANVKQINRILINKKLIGHGYYRFHDLIVLINSQGERPYVLLNKDEYLAWGEPNHFRESSCAQDMLHFLENLRVSDDSKNCDVDGHPIHGKSLDNFIFWNEDEIFWYRNISRKWEKQALAAENNLVESEKLMQKIERHIQLSDPLVSTSSFLQILMDDLEEVGVHLNENKFNKLIQLYMNINNQSRLWCNCGWSPEELAAMAHSAPTPIAFGPGL